MRAQVSKRQVEAKLPEVALKEKRTSHLGEERAWWLKAEFELLYHYHLERGFAMPGGDGDGDDGDDRDGSNGDGA